MAAAGLAVGDAMTRPLRRRHLVVWAVLAVVLPLLFALGLLAR